MDIALPARRLVEVLAANRTAFVDAVIAALNDAADEVEQQRAAHERGLTRLPKDCALACETFPALGCGRR